MCLRIKKVRVRIRGQPIAGTVAPDISVLRSSPTVARLRRELEARGCDTTGTKAALVQRLTEAMQADGVAGLPLELLAHVEQDGPGVGGPGRVGLARTDLADLLARLAEEIGV